MWRYVMGGSGELPRNVKVSDDMSTAILQIPTLPSAWRWTLCLLGE